MTTAAPALRLFTGEAPEIPEPPQSDPVPPSPEEEWTLREALERRVIPKLKRSGRAQQTLDNWRNAVECWETVRPDNPAISLITEEDLTLFVDALPEAFDYCHKTANKKLTHVQGILKRCEDILGRRAPQGDPLAKQPATKVRRIVPDDVLDLIYRRCNVATLSHDPRLPAPLVWRSLLTLFSTLGPRRSEACKMPRSAWRRDPEYPSLPEYPQLESDAESPHGWLVFATPKTERAKDGLPLVLPVPKILADHLAEMERLSPRRARMFPIGTSDSSWRKQLLRIQWGVTTIRGFEIPDAPEYTFQDLRKTTGRRYRRHAGRDVSGFLLGHKPRGVNATYYDELTHDAVEAVIGLPDSKKHRLPPAFYSFG
jgi:integrase